MTMIYVEDIVEELMNKDLSPFDRSFINDMYSLVMRNFSFTTKQLDVIIKIIEKTRTEFTNINIDKIINEKPCRKPPKQSIEILPEVRYAGKNILLIRYKYSNAIIKAIQRLKTPMDYFDKDNKVWVIHVVESNLSQIMKLIKDYNLSFDDQVVAFLAECDNSLRMQSIATVKDDEVTVIVRNDELLMTWLEWADNV